MMIDEKKLDEVAEMIKNSENIVIFTGAGHSTESGIDDFRSPGMIPLFMQVIIIFSKIRVNFGTCIMN